jgi:hypothetical protein
VIGFRVRGTSNGHHTPGFFIEPMKLDYTLVFFAIFSFSVLVIPADLTSISRVAGCTAKKCWKKQLKVIGC